MRYVLLDYIKYINFVSIKSTLPMVHIGLPVSRPFCAAFLSYLYPERDGDGFLVVRSDIFGKLAVAHVKVSDRPVAGSHGPSDVPLRLPDSDASRGLADRWTYYSSSDIAALNWALEALFDLDFRSYCAKGLRLGFMKKDVVEAYVQSRGLCDIGGFDTLHKRVYRGELASFRKAKDVLLRRLYYIDESIDMKGLGR